MTVSVTSAAFHLFAVAEVRPAIQPSGAASLGEENHESRSMIAFHRALLIHPIRITRFRCTIFSEGQGRPSTLLLIGSAISSGKLFRSWVLKVQSLVIQIGCSILQTDYLHRNTAMDDSIGYLRPIHAVIIDPHN